MALKKYLNTDYSTRVTKIKNRWHCQLYYKNKLIDEMACRLRIDIGRCFQTMIRWEDKCNGGDRFTSASRKRMWDNNKSPQMHFVGEVFSFYKLKSEKEKSDVQIS